MTSAIGTGVHGHRVQEQGRNLELYSTSGEVLPWVLGKCVALGINRNILSNVDLPGPSINGTISWIWGRYVGSSNGIGRTSVRAIEKSCEVVLAQVPGTFFREGGIVVYTEVTRSTSNE